MNKEEIQTRISAISQEMVQTKAHYVKLEGHLGECQHWLSEMIKSEGCEPCDKIKKLHEDEN